MATFSHGACPWTPLVIRAFSVPVARVFFLLRLLQSFCQLVKTLLETLVVVSNFPV